MHEVSGTAPYSTNYPYYGTHPGAAMQVESGMRGPNEISGDRNWPREMEGTSRFQQEGVWELPASPMYDPPRDGKNR